MYKNNANLLLKFLINIFPLLLNISVFLFIFIISSNRACPFSSTCLGAVVGGVIFTSGASSAGAGAGAGLVGSFSVSSS